MEGVIEGDHPSYSCISLLFFPLSSRLFIVPVVSLIIVQHVVLSFSLQAYVNMSSQTVILGAGIIGVSTAYYLSQHQEPSTIHLVEPSPELFSSASGYAGGFLAKDWFAPSLSALGALSFEEHRRLAEEHGGREKWGYSPATCVSYAASAADRDSQTRGDDWYVQSRLVGGFAHRK